MFKTNMMTNKKRCSSKGICSNCGKEYRVRGIVKINGKYLCQHCRMKSETSRSNYSAGSIGRGKISLDEALNRIYTAKVYSKGSNSKGASTQCGVSFPICMAEKKFKVILVDDGKNEDIQGEVYNSQREEV